MKKRKHTQFDNAKTAASATESPPPSARKQLKLSGSVNCDIPLISQLPDEVMVIIFTKLDIGDIAACLFVNRRWYAIAQDGNVWRILYARFWSVDTTSWKSLYKEQYQEHELTDIARLRKAIVPHRCRKVANGYFNLTVVPLYNRDYDDRYEYSASTAAEDENENDDDEDVDSPYGSSDTGKPRFALYGDLSSVRGEVVGTGYYVAPELPGTPATDTAVSSCLNENDDDDIFEMSTKLFGPKTTTTATTTTTTTTTTEGEEEEEDEDDEGEGEKGEAWQSALDKLNSEEGGNIKTASDRTVRQIIDEQLCRTEYCSEARREAENLGQPLGDGWTEIQQQEMKRRIKRLLRFSPNSGRDLLAHDEAKSHTEWLLSYFPPRSSRYFMANYVPNQVRDYIEGLALINNSKFGLLWLEEFNT
eukprot:TRINITY_DN3370_c1_g1_i1.p1 TRINITY_DN3370_c1_g1~~TRINITY_DN3370_c1_g1_i1.p1  ORF type:complete len:418 (-),score=90.68 TRINITY_DN3370_c1_g1_i1:10-1263(-)